MDTIVTDFLRRLRSAGQGCFAAALVDLDTDMVLSTDPDAALDAEVWDALTLKMSDLLTSDHAQGVLRLISDREDDMLCCVCLRRKTDLFVMIRSRAEPPLGVILACNQPVAAQVFVDAAKEELEAFATAD